MSVTIVIPTRNMAAYLPLAIDSVRRQTFTDWELHIIDDGSTDATPEAVRRYFDDNRIHYWRQANQERAAARNQGIARSSGEFLAFLDADDLWHPEKLEKQLAQLRSHPNAALCYTTVRYIDANGTLLEPAIRHSVREGYILPELVRGNFIPVSSVVLRRSVLDSTGTFDTDPHLTGGEDWDLWIRISTQHPVVAVAEELTLYRVHNTPRSHRLILSGALAVLDKQFGNAEFPKQARITKRRAKAYTYLCSAGFAATSLARSERFKLLLKGTSIAPSSLVSSAGLLAVARLLLPPQVITTLKRLTTNVMNYR